MWELSCFCNLNLASVCISIKIQSLMISHTILCHMSVHRRDCAEFLLTLFCFLCCSASRSCPSRATKILWRPFFHKVSFIVFIRNRGQLLHWHVTVFLHYPVCEERSPSLFPFCRWGMEVQGGWSQRYPLVWGAHFKTPHTLLSRLPLPATSVTAASTECSCISDTGIRTGSPEMKHT